MIVDILNSESGLEIDADICIIGAGAAGITIARSFAGTSVGVCVLESGGKEFEDETQALYVAENVGLPRFDHDATRLRYFGGTTNHWTGQCAPFLDEDFRAREWVQASGWPIGLGDLLPYYANAYGICDLDPSPFEKGIAGFKGRDLPNLDHDRLEPYFLQYSAPTRFGPTYGPELERAKNIQVLLHANVTDISANADASAVDHVAFRSLSGRTGRVRARRVVLCCGGIENARMLLLSNGRVQAGLGNQNDVVGRYFMDHPFGRVGLLQRTGDVAIGKALGEHQIGDRQYRFGLSLAQKVQAHDRVLGCGIQFWPTSDSAPDSPSGETTLISRYTDKIVKNFNHYWAQLKQQLGEQESPGEAEFFDIMAVTEQAPNPMSRVSLSRERDALGLPRTRVDWQLTELDRRTREFAVRAIATEFGRLDTGRVRMASWLQDRGNWNDNVEDYKHHMGTTRMAANPRLGVVDKDCRVHGLANLYIAGSSVFPTSSIVNPTLTIVALALRLSESLKKSLT